MRIKDVEALVGISRKNIRFYEAEGLLTPKRSANDYREYGEEEIRWLKQIKMLRQLSVPLEQIRLLKAGAVSLSALMERQQRLLEREQRDLAHKCELCQRLAREPLDLETLDADELLQRMERLELEGVNFTNVKERDRKRRLGGAVAAAVAFVLVLGMTAAIWVVAMLTEPEMTWLFVVLLVLTAAILVALCYALWQRIVEIQGGEEDEARKY